MQIRRRKLRYLLYYLACQDQPVSRDALCDVFWPNQEDREARKNLRESLSILRNELSDEDYILRQGDYVSLDEGKVYCDFLEFERITNFLRKSMDISATGILSDEVYLKIQVALHLWKGAGFMVGIEGIDSEVFQRWVLETHESSEYWRQVMMEWMADHCIAQGNLKEALTWLSQALLSDPHNTELNILSLNCMRDLGSWSEMLHFCDRLESVYQENGVSTLPPVLRDTIGRFRELARNPVKEPPAIWEDPNAHQIHFIGIKTRIAALNNRLYNGGLILLRGEAGSGKSRLIREFYNSLEVIPRLMYYRAKPGDETIPYQALVEAIRKITSEEEWRSLTPIYAKALFPLFPFIDKIRTDIRPEDLSFAVGLNRLIPEAFFALFTLIARRRRCLLVWDDAHWCDADSLHVLSFIHERGGPEEIGMAILTARVEITNVPLEKLLLRYATNRFVDVIDIAPLTPEEVCEIGFLEEGKRPAEEDCAWLAAESGGNAELLIELLNSIKESGRPSEDYVGGRSYPINPGLEQAVKNHLDGLGETDLEVLSVAAALEGDIRPDILEKVGNIAPDRLEKSLQALEKKHLLRPVAVEFGLGGYEFIHGVVQKFMHEKIAPQKRRDVHLKAVQALGESGGDNLKISTAMARHLECAGDLAQAFQFWMRAAHQASNVNLIKQIYLAYGRALQLTDLLGEKCSSEDFYQLVVGWADYAFGLDDVATCEKLYGRCLREGRAREDARLIGVAESGLGWVESLRGNDALALEMIERSLGKFRQDDARRDAARTYLFKGIIHTRKYEFANAVIDFEKIHALLREDAEEGSQELTLRMAACLVFAYCEVGRVGQAREFALRALELARLNEQTFITLQIRAAMVTVEMVAGNLAAARELVRDLDVHLAGMGINWWVLVYRMSKVRVLLETGEVNEGWQCLNEVIDYCERDQKYAPSLAYACSLKGDLLRRLGDVAAARFWLEKGIALNNNRLATLSNQICLSMVYFLQAEKEKGLDLLNALLEEIGPKDFALLDIDARMARQLLFPEQFTQAQAAAEFAYLERRLKESGYEFMTPQLLYLQGLSEIRQGNELQGTMLFSAAMQEAQARGAYWMQLTTLRGILSNTQTGFAGNEERRQFRRLLEQLRANLVTEEQEISLKRFIKRQESLIKH